MQIDSFYIKKGNGLRIIVFYILKRDKQKSNEIEKFYLIDLNNWKIVNIPWLLIPTFISKGKYINLWRSSHFYFMHYFYLIIISISSSLLICIKKSMKWNEHQRKWIVDFLLFFAHVVIGQHGSFFFFKVLEFSPNHKA